MGTVLLDVSISLDGYLAGPGVSAEHPMGQGGERLHEWLFGQSPDEHDKAVAKELNGTVGATVLGRRTFDVGLAQWGGTPFPAPAFVLTHRPQPDLAMSSGTFHFVTDGPDSAVRQARAAAGDRHVAVLGADVTRQLLDAGLLEEIRVHIVPVLLGRGVRLFEHLGATVDLEQVGSVPSSRMAHLTYRVRR
jgi:dihydrofolate reductase